MAVQTTPFAMAYRLFKQNRFDEAKTKCDEILKRSPKDPQALELISIIFLNRNDFLSAIGTLEARAKINPVPASVYQNLGLALRNTRQTARAASAYNRAIALNPGDATLHYSLGNCHADANNFEEAIKSYDKAIQLKPGYAEAHNNRGSAAKQLQRLDEALVNYDKAISLKPDYADAHNNRGIVLKELNRLHEALESYDKAIALEPGNASFYADRGSLLQEMGKQDEAEKDYWEEFRIAAANDSEAESVARDCLRFLSIGDIPAVYSSEAELLMTRERVETVLDELSKKYQGAAVFNKRQVDVAKRAVHKFTGFYLAYQQQNDRETMEKLSALASKLLNIAEPRKRQDSQAGGNASRIRIGIASARLCDHNGANWAYNWMAKLPGKDYAFFTYNFGSIKDELAKKFAELGIHRELVISPQKQDEIIGQMRKDQLDFLMLPDVGMTSVSRLLSLHRIAPRQFTAWGHPVTTGSAQMDYYLSSDLMEPPEAQDHYSEKLVRMPNLALYLDDRKETELAKKDFGLPAGRVLYGCLQSLFKYLPRYDEILPRIAQEMPEALFVFLESKLPYANGILQNRLANAFQKFGLDAGRHIVLLPRQKPSDYDCLLQSMDVSIDSVGWSGGNTSLKTIRYGVPLITLPGTYMRGRHTYAMFRMMNADELIASSLDDYVEKLVRAGKEQEYRRHISQVLSANKEKLFRDASFAKALDGFFKDFLTAG